MTTSTQIRDLFVQALKGHTDAGQAVYSPFDWPTAPDSYPLILVHCRKERKVSLGPNVPQFDVYSILDITARTKSPALAGDEGSKVALAAVEALKGQIEVALINNPAVWVDPNGGQRIEQFSSIDSEVNTSSEGDMPMGELSMQIEVKFYQGPEDFYPIPKAPLQTIGLTILAPEGTQQLGLTIDLPQ
ncbi:ABC transporter permease [Cupriavidus pauculus]|uniref:ABC transporter permease n=1 Tax=Cupriavidus pauculus TaxID=82633 RepID=UPI001EE22B8E|nr:ABC transporter permease [Cupriavidus pauculus]GJG92838.1 ABC transporter permease [Cupriavidus pauculus]